MAPAKPKARRCQWCSEPFHSDHPTKLFCSKQHKEAFGNYMASRGKVLMPIVMAWRATRGRKGSGGDDAFREMTEFVDKCVAELVDQGSQPIIHHYRKTRQSGVGVTGWKDGNRLRPSRA